MKAILFAGGYGTRLSEETTVKPKPMVEIGGKPILWHIMKLYSHYGVNEFIILCGYKGYMIKEYFENYFLHMSDITFDMSTNTTTIHEQRAESWKVTLLDTGEDTMTGGRLKKAFEFVKNEECFCLTYGDGLCDVNIGETIRFHKSHNKKATLLSVVPPGRFGVLELDGDNVIQFQEKPQGDGYKINGGFFVLSPDIFRYLADDKTIWEQEPLQNLARDAQLKAFNHSGFWHPMDTLRDKNFLQKLWEEDRAPWKVW